MVDLLLFALWGLLIIGSARSQVDAPTCTDTSFVWSYNTLNQNPCLVAAYIAAVCNNGEFDVPALLPQNSYAGPSGTDNGDICKCNVVFYNLISACGACQGETWIPYAAWTRNCTSTWASQANVTDNLPKPVPAGTRVQQWALHDPGTNWDPQVAESIGDTPEVTGSATNVVPTQTKQSTYTPSASSSTSSTHTGGSSNSGAIAGGVVGGVIAACSIAGVVAWFTIRRRRRARSAPSAAYMDGGGGGNMDQTAAPYPLSLETLRLYDPSDPSTYPTQAPSPTIHTTSQYPSSTPDLQPNRLVHPGLPEI